MPTYVYRCIETGEEFEYFQKMSDPALTEWPEDVPGYEPGKTKHVKRIISGNVGVVLTGTGFYQTDYVKKNNGGSE